MCEQYQKSVGKKPYLHDVARQIHGLCDQIFINLIPSWIPRESNTDADFLSRCLDSDDWSVQDFLFFLLNKKWGPYTFDRFACDYNAKCKKI